MLKWLKNIDWAPLVGAALALTFAFSVLPSGQPSLATFNNEPAQKHSTQESDNEEQPVSWWDWTTHDSAGFYTFVLDVLTGMVFVAGAFLSVYTYRLWEAGERQSKLARQATFANIIAAKAAKKSAESAFEAERARFYAVINENSLKWITDYAEQTFIPPRPDDAPVKFQVSYTFRNYGKTPGIITETAIGCTVAEEPPDPVFTVELNNFTEYMIGSGDTTATKKFAQDVTFADARAIRRNTKRLWLYGRLYYDDVFGNHRVHRFYFRSVREGDRCILQPYRYKHYNEST